jgi:hypothetical protein
MHQFGQPDLAFDFLQQVPYYDEEPAAIAKAVGRAGANCNDHRLILLSFIA